MRFGSAKDVADLAHFERTKRLPVHDGQRRVVVMTRGKLTWEIDIGETASDEHARDHAEAMSEDNGGGWKFKEIKDRFEHEAPDEG